MPRPLNRREWTQLVGGGVAAWAVGPAGGCGDNQSGPQGAAAILEPSSDAFIVSVWAPGATAGTVVVDDGEALRREPIAIASTGTGHVVIAGLAADATYHVTVELPRSPALGPHRVRTAPRADDPRPVRLAVTADIDPHPDFESDLGEHVALATPELLITLGDFPYVDDGPVPETAAAIRDRHGAVRSAPRVRALLETAGVRAIYDDHEVRNDWDGAVTVAEADRVRTSLAVWDELFPLGAAPPPTDVRYRRWRWGQNVECFLLDTRRYRSANAAPDDEQKTMLGATQLAWLLAGARESAAVFKLVLTSVPLDFAHGTDAWQVFTTERAALFEGLAGIPGVLFISGDQHWFGVHRHAPGIRELQVGPFARGTFAPPPARAGVLFTASTYNVGLLDVAADRITIAGLGPGGERFYEETLTPAELTPGL